jgi:hypothetical protein
VRRAGGGRPNVSNRTCGRLLRLTRSGNLGMGWHPAGVCSHALGRYDDAASGRLHRAIRLNGGTREDQKALPLPCSRTDMLRLGHRQRSWAGIAKYTHWEASLSGSGLVVSRCCSGERTNRVGRSAKAAETKQTSPRRGRSRHAVKRRGMICHRLLGVPFFPATWCNPASEFRLRIYGRPPGAVIQGRQ